MTAVIYARYSSDNQREESIEGQIRECTAYAEKNGITVIKHYIDRAFSAKTDNRPEFQQTVSNIAVNLLHVAEGCMGNFHIILLHLCCSLNCANALAASTVSPF